MILKPCPFCGAKGPSEYSELGELDAQNKAKAAWNRRRNPTKGAQK